jgi:hypothetical protein
LSTPFHIACPKVAALDRKLGPSFRLAFARLASNLRNWNGPPGIHEEPVACNTTGRDLALQ